MEASYKVLTSRRASTTSISIVWPTCKQLPSHVVTSFINQRPFHFRDLGTENIMMSGEQLYPRGHHPARSQCDITGHFRAEFIRRRDVASSQPVKYYFIDFEAAAKYDESVLSPRMSYYYGQGQDDELPELGFSDPYDPFPVDVFTLGNVYKKRLVKVSVFCSGSLAIHYTDYCESLIHRHAQI